MKEHTPKIENSSQMTNLPKSQDKPCPTKLHISEPGDQYEREAESVADQVLRLPESTLQTEPSKTSALPLVQRNVSRHDEGLGAIPSLVQDVLSSSGQPLDTTTRAFFEPRFRHDFSHVRVHSDAKAAESAEAVNAQAYTVGDNIVFAKGQYELEQPRGKELLAHELTHVMQQGSMGATENRNLHRRKNREDSVEASPESLGVRLAEEIIVGAEKRAWTGVDKKYNELENLGEDAFGSVENPAQIHQLGADAARALGHFEEFRIRLLLAKTALDTDIGQIDDTALRNILAELEGIKEFYGAIRIAPRSEPKSKRKKEKLSGPALELIEGPPTFATGILFSIEVANNEITETGYFKGLIPAGEYTLGGMPFTVEKGTTPTDSHVPTVFWEN